MSDRLTVAVTGIGAIIGQGIVRSLRQCRQPIRIVGIDRNPDSIAPFICDVFHAKPACDETDAGYLEFWRQLIASESVDLVLPGIEVDLFFLNDNRDLLTGSGAVLGLNRPALIDLAHDKWQLAQTLPDAGLTPIPALRDAGWQECIDRLGPPPLLLKPVHGNGSRGIIRLEDETDFEYWSRKSAGKFMIQRIIGTDNEEYTVGAFGLGDGTSVSSIIFRRSLSLEGNTSYAEVVEDPVIAQATSMLDDYFKPLGPTNYQFRKENNTAYLLEINPRLSSSSSLRTCFGYNEAQMAVDFFVRGVTPEVPHVRPGRAWRYAEDFVSP